MSNFGELLKDFRKRTNMTRKELAAALGISEAALSGYEQGTRCPSPETLIKIVIVFYSHPGME